jgi:hypothetical protein
MRYDIMYAIVFFLVLGFGTGNVMAAESSKASMADRVVIDEKYRKTLDHAEGITLQEDPGAEDSYGVKFVVIGKMRYELIDSTEIIDVDGESIQPDQLPVPCEADVSYQIVGHGTRNVLSIQILRKMNNSSKEWNRFSPE